MTDFDSPWKEAVDCFLQDFLKLLFPLVHDVVDWNREPEFLDKELQQIVRDAELGRRFVDKLVKVWLLDGREQWVLIHIEVQGDEEWGFERRMFEYFMRLTDAYDRPVISLAVLADENPDWRPRAYESELCGCRILFEYPIAKLMDWSERWSELESSQNRIAFAVMAHLKSKETRRDPEARLMWKLNLCRNLYRAGWIREDVLELLRFLDWIMVLPAALAADFTRQHDVMEREHAMPAYVTTWERNALAKGLVEGRVEGRTEGRTEALRETLCETIEVRFGQLDAALLEEINRLSDEELRRMHRAALVASSLDELKAQWPKPAQPE